MNINKLISQNSKGLAFSGFKTNFAKTYLTDRYPYWPFHIILVFPDSKFSFTIKNRIIGLFASSRIHAKKLRR